MGYNNGRFNDSNSWNDPWEDDRGSGPRGSFSSQDQNAQARYQGEGFGGGGPGGGGDIYGRAGLGGLSLLDDRNLYVGRRKSKYGHGPSFYAQAVRAAQQPGGALSSLGMNRAYGGQISSLIGAERSRSLEGMRSMQQAGVSAQLAGAMYAEDPFRAMRAAAPLRAGMESELQENQLNADIGLSQMVQQSEGFQASLRESEKNRSAANRQNTTDLIVGVGTAAIAASDKRLKKDVETIDNALETVLAMRGVTFEYTDPEFAEHEPGEYTGFIAQEMEEVRPDWVHEFKDGYKGIRIEGFEALVVEALREVVKENYRLRMKVEAIEEELAVSTF